MKKLIPFTILSLCAFFCNAQVKLDSSSRNFWVYQPSYPACDTVKCLFLEIADSTETWKRGFVVRNNGMVKFGKTIVSPEYLPVTSAIVTSQLFYEDKVKVTNKAIHVVLLSQQTNK
jgi:hypothetical protein